MIAPGWRSAATEMGGRAGWDSWMAFYSVGEVGVQRAEGFGFSPTGASARVASCQTAGRPIRVAQEEPPPKIPAGRRLK